jgi:hypothetical protein
MVEWRTQHSLFAGVVLRQREWDRAHGDEQKQVKRASNKMGFDGGVNLLFHFDVFIGPEEAKDGQQGKQSSV